MKIITKEVYLDLLNKYEKLLNFQHWLFFSSGKEKHTQIITFSGGEYIKLEHNFNFPGAKDMSAEDIINKILRTYDFSKENNLTINNGQILYT